MWETGGSEEGQEIFGEGILWRSSGVGRAVGRGLDLDEIGDEGGDDCDPDRERYGEGEEFRLYARVEGRSED